MRKRIEKLTALVLALLALAAALSGCGKTVPADVVVDIDEPTATEQARVTRAPEGGQTSAPSDEPFSPAPTEAYVNPPALMSKSGKYVTYDGTNVMRVDDRAFEMCVYLEDVAKQYAGLINDTAKALKGRTNVYSLIIPMSYGVMMPDDVRGKISFYIDMEDCIDRTYAEMPDVTAVPVFRTMMMHRNEFIYFRTDHHWTARGAHYAYQEFIKAAGKTPNQLSAYREVSFGGFLGSLYKDSGKDPALSEEETVYAYYPISEGVKMVIHSSNGNEFEYPIVTDVTNYSQSSKYDVFAGEDNPLTVFTNPSVTDGSVLIIVKESFGNAMMAFLCDHYSTVYEIDYRYWKGNLVSFAKEVGASDLLFANNFMMISSSSNVGKLSLIIK